VLDCMDVIGQLGLVFYLTTFYDNVWYGNPYSVGGNEKMAENISLRTKIRTTGPPNKTLDVRSISYLITTPER